MPNELEIKVSDVEAQWQNYVDSYNEPMKGEAWAQSGIWRLVGNGEQSAPDCGAHRGFLICDNAEGHDHKDLYGFNWDGYAEIHLKHKSCFSYNCPICYLSWAVQGAHRISDKLESLGVKYGLADHIIASLPSECFNLKEGKQEYFNSNNPDFDKLCIYMVKVLEKRGIVGGCMIFHGFRYATKKEAEYKGVKSGWRWSPHFHILGFIRQKKLFYKLTAEEYKKDGILVNLKAKRQSVFGTAWYQLNHASVQFNKKMFNVTRWFGDIVNPDSRKMAENSKKIRQLKKSTAIEAPTLINQLQADNRSLKAKIKASENKEHPLKCTLCGRELKKGNYYGVRIDMKPSLQETKVKLIKGVLYKKNSRRIFYDKIIDEKNGVVNWA